ncbi:thymus-specific serine protease-like isoform X2 [Agrilus planipennis]|uniref:Thymus-specific serine protease-like isoform X2 n=1 Tax=Agrilus planipennis TaxID=224129 RepID=A0A7F5QVU0_AGRPL|nr:thymus-specific serine protease-like isoform X2 [Agrilus planipennis]
MWVFFGSLFLLTTGTFSVEGEISFMRHGIPPARETDETRASSPEWGTISQRVDHFNPADNRMWDMRYIQNNEFYEEGGPMFVFIGGEWVISKGWATSGFFLDIARSHKDAFFYTEHRFYGDSYPIYTCEPLKGPVEPDRSYFLTSLSSPFADVVQTADPGDLVAECERLENNTGSDLEKLAKYIKPLQYCIWTYDLFKEYYSETHAIGVRMRSK